MGRELRRVSLDFQWPHNKVWEGFLNPYSSEECPACDGSGYAPEARVFHDQWYGQAPFDPSAYGSSPIQADHPVIQSVAQKHVQRDHEFYTRQGVLSDEKAIADEAERLAALFRKRWQHHLVQADVDALVVANRLWDFTRLPRTDEQREIQKQKMSEGGNCWLPQSNGYTPTAAEVNAWSMSGMGHDSINCHVCITARCAREGVPMSCNQCNGSGQSWSSPEVKKQHDDWKPTPPPDGPGFQLWETTSEGSPVSPVFDSLEALCNWCAANATTFGNFTASAVKWQEMLGAKFVHAKDESGNVFL